MMMNELLLQKIWKLQFFNHELLKTTCGKDIVIYFPGVLNCNAGPDFLHARLKISDTEWAGNIELHIRTSDWFKHQHQHDRMYSNVILHVVWENDMELFIHSPVLTLQDRFIAMESNVIDSIVSLHQKVVCATKLKNHHITIEIQNNLLKSRLEKKCAQVESLLKRSNYDWEQVVWVLLCRNFGYHVNEAAFEQIAHILSYKIIQKYLNDPIALDALLFGVAGLLNENFIDSYPIQLKMHFTRLKQFHSLKDGGIKLLFLRMRPMNFPTIRLAQLSALLHHNRDCMKTFLRIENFNDFKHYFQCKMNTYWDDHFLFDKLSSHSIKHLGSSLMNNIYVNTVVPLKVTSLQKLNRQEALKKGISMLISIKPESNHIVQKYSKIGIKVDSAAVSQALIELYHSFCAPKNCLECMVAQEIANKMKSN